MKSKFRDSFLRESSETLRAIAHPIRIAIIDLLYHNDKLSVTEIYEALDIEQAIASHHLRLLKNKRVVDLERDGKNSNYFLVSKDYYGIISLMSKLK
jgi:ArsR family transcriptional regulator